MVQRDEVIIFSILFNPCVAIAYMMHVSVSEDLKFMSELMLNACTSVEHS